MMLLLLTPPWNLNLFIFEFVLFTHIRFSGCIWLPRLNRFSEIQIRKPETQIQLAWVSNNYTKWSLFETLKSQCIVCAANTLVHILKILRILLWYSKIRKFRFQRGLCSALVRGSARNTFCWHWPLAAFGLNAARVAICQTWLSWLVTITQHATNEEEDENDEDQNFEKRLRKKGQKMMT